MFPSLSLNRGSTTRVRTSWTKARREKEFSLHANRALPLQVALFILTSRASREEYVERIKLSYPFPRRTLADFLIELLSPDLAELLDVFLADLHYIIVPESGDPDKAARVGVTLLTLP